jgi:hypothetical protein
MTHKFVARPPRRGAITPLTAFMLVFLIGMVSFVVDLGWVVVVRTELQAAADAAALAGADPLMDGYVQYQMATAASQPTILSNAMSAARTKAKNFASYNGAGGVGSLTLLDSDIEFGLTDASGNYTAYNSNSPVFPNTIKVVLRRDSSANGSLNLFFAQVLGNSTANVSARAAATITGGVVDSFSSSTPHNIGVLPVAYDVNAWNNFISTGFWPDGTSSYDANGVAQLQVYPYVKDTGNFGLLSLDDSHIGASTINGWINYGVSASDVTALQSANLIPLSAHNPLSWDWSGDTGFKSDNVQTMNNYIGTKFWLPLFTPYNASDASYQAGVGTGSGYNYNIVQFVGVKIVQPPKSNGQVYIEPAAMLDSSAVFSTTAVVDTSRPSSALVTTFSYPRLSQ